MNKNKNQNAIRSLERFLGEVSPEAKDRKVSINILDFIDFIPKWQQLADKLADEAADANNHTLAQALRYCQSAKDLIRIGREASGPKADEISMSVFFYGKEVGLI